MIRDPSDGSASHEKPEPRIPVSEIAGFSPVIDTSTSGLPITAKESYLARLEESRKWLKSYVRPTIIEKGQ